MGNKHVEFCSLSQVFDEIHTSIVFQVCVLPSQVDRDMVAGGIRSPISFTFNLLENGCSEVEKAKKCRIIHEELLT